MSDLQRALDFFAAARVFGIRPGLDRIKALLEELDHPEMKVPAVHIAGTNGKGSVSAMLTAIAAKDDKRVGWYTSPYLENFNERIRVIEGREGFQRFMDAPRSAEIKDSELASIVERLKLASLNMQDKGFEAPTEFELITATAYCYFAERNCDLLILETGMGGRLDATNVILNPVVSVITALGYDHQDRLGNHLSEIAGEKAGIIKEGCPLVFLDPKAANDQRGEAEAATEVLIQVAKAKAAPYEKITLEMLNPVKSDDRTSQSFYFQGEEEPYTLALMGRYQLLNAGLAIAAARHFASSQAIREGLREARWPGRLEFLRQEPAVLIDGAHNLQGCQSLGEELTRFFSGEELLLFTGMLEDKEHRVMLKEIFEGARFKTKAVFVSRPPVPRGFPAESLAAEIQAFLPTAKILPFSSFELESLLSSEHPILYYEDDYEVVAKRLISIADAMKMPLAAFGSLYLIGNARPLLRKDL